MIGLYIHIPFCLAKCRYCGFNSRPARPGIIEAYLGALEAELEAFARTSPGELGTVYFGGGTPTMLDGAQLERLLGTVHRRFRLAADAEVSVEANPGTLDGGKARLLHGLGVNRVTLGIQSLRDDALRLLGRVHTALEALECLGILRAAGFDNIGADLIYALPGQTPSTWEEDLMRLAALSPEHLSLYSLTVEKGTPFARRKERGTLPLPSEDEEIAMYRAAREITARAGYEHYEISNYAKKGRRSRHNMIYWTGGDYYGAGAGAHSFFRNPRPVRFANVRDPSAYIRRLEAGKSPRAMAEELPARTLAAEALMLGLRLMEGIALDRFAAELGVEPLGSFREELAEGFGRGWLEVEGGRVRFTGEGILFSDRVFAALF